MAQQDGQVHKVLGSEALGILFGRWRDGTFSGIADDWRWIAGYTKRYRWAVALYIVLGVAESSLSLVSAVAGKYALHIITGSQLSRLRVLLVLLVAFLVVGPKDLPKVARWLGRTVKKSRRLLNEIKKESGWDELEKEVRDVQHDVKDAVKQGDVSAELREAKQSVQASAEKFDKDTKSN